MTKNKCLLIGFHAVAVASITAGYICMYKKLKKPKLNVESLRSFD